MIRTYTSEAIAESEARALTRARTRRHPRGPRVIVEGPAAGEWSTMDLAEAIDGGFCYRWVV